MAPSSRTPEGEPNRCPVCGNAVRLDPSVPSGDAPCAFCGFLLWFSFPSDAEFADLKTHVYEVTRREQARGRVWLDLDFIREDVGL
jgi:hypothetical protein